MYLLDLLLVSPPREDRPRIHLHNNIMREASIFIHIPHQARTLLMASITSSSHRWVRSIGHSQSCYHLKPFLPLHSPSFFSRYYLCPLSAFSLLQSFPIAHWSAWHPAWRALFLFPNSSYLHTTPHTDTPTLSSPHHLSFIYTHIHITTQPHTWASLILPDSSLEPLYIWWSLLALSFYQDLHDAGSVLR